MDLGSPSILIPNSLHVNVCIYSINTLALPLIYIQRIQLLTCVSRECLPQAFEQDIQNDFLGLNLMTLWLWYSLSKMATCHSCCGIFFSSLSNSLNMHLFLNRTVGQCIITRLWASIVPHAVYLHTLIQVEEVICSVQTQYIGVLQLLSSPRCETVSCHAKRQIKKLPMFFFVLFFFIGALTSGPSLISYFLCCVGSLTHTFLDCGVVCCLKFCSTVTFPIRQVVFFHM